MPRKEKPGGAGHNAFRVQDYTLDECLSHLQGVTRSSAGYKALCPAHSDRTPSLSINIGKNGRPVLHCHAGCDYDSIMAAMGMDRPDTRQPSRQSTTKRITALYDYCDEQGLLLYQKVRYEPKSLAIRRPDGDGWTWSKDDARPVLYRWPEVIQAIAAGKVIFIPEGEKDVDRLHSAGLTATANIEGTSEPGKRPKWRREYSEQLAGAPRVVLLPDNDPAGKAHAGYIARQLAGKVQDIRVVELPGLPEKGDVSGWLDTGHSVDELLQRVEATEPYQPGQAHDQAPPPDYSDYPEAQGHSPEHAGPDSETDNAPADNGLPEISFTAEDFLVEPPPAPFLITGFFPVDVCFTNATGGTGKSTFELFKCIHVILGMEFLSMPIERPGPVVYVTAEDDGDRIKRRLYWIMEAMDLTPTQRRQMAENFKVVNLCGLGYRLAALDRYGNITRTHLADRIVRKYRAVEPILIEFDPIIKFSPGERHINDSEDAVINAMMFIGRELSCATHGIHHASKMVFRDGVIDHLAGRGGSAMGDGARGVYSLIQVDKETFGLPGISSVYQHYIDAGELMALFATKLTDCKRPRDPFILRRNGWTFELLAKPTPEGVEQAHRQQQQEKTRLALGKLMAHLQEWSFKHFTQRDLERDAEIIGIPRAMLRSAISLGMLEQRLVERPLPESERHGGRQTGIYLAEGT